MKALLIPLFVLVSSGHCWAQEVEHNYTVGPQSTTCDSLRLQGSSASEMIDEIKASKFRFDQAFRLTRRQGFKAGAFYSCDNETGYLIIEYNDETLLYHNVDKQSWNNMIKSSDPEGYFLDIRKQLEAIP